jgi:cytochrome oxidase assembly protein ShyY1
MIYSSSTQVSLVSHELSTRTPGHNIDNLTNAIVRVQALNTQSLQTLKLSQLPYFKIALGDSALITSHWSPLRMSPEKHEAYALQWFLLAIVALAVLISSSSHVNHS